MQPFTILVLCTGNSARSILAEALFNRKGAGRVTACSAGSKPVGRVNPAALTLLTSEGYDTGSFRSKSWDEFSDGSRDVPIDLVITVCASAAGEACPVWPGSPQTVHWGFDDPAAVGDAEKRDQAFRAVYHGLEALVEQFLAIDPTALRTQAGRDLIQGIR